ncbi:hypothetical protein L596_004390 [Steinernema carpocapsae]|uniref:Uncharacterized protein n=1 Tax=Steinernema carpocapsae TaxID=34508 RepID=A0A4U8UX66_STECR|nr:hypothetical protein L596_004390 [Steinernema carpocapsae]
MNEVESVWHDITELRESKKCEFFVLAGRKLARGLGFWLLSRNMLMGLLHSDTGSEPESAIPAKAFTESCPSTSFLVFFF